MMSDTLRNTEEFIIALDKQVSAGRSNRTVAANWAQN